MGIYVKNMKMPKTCAKCHFFEPYSIACHITDYFLDRDDYRFERDKDCPLIEISKSHGDLIDRQEAINEVCRMMHECFGADEEELDAIEVTLHELHPTQLEH